MQTDMISLGKKWIFLLVETYNIVILRVKAGNLNFTNEEKRC